MSTSIDLNSLYNYQTKYINSLSGVDTELNTKVSSLQTALNSLYDGYKTSYATTTDVLTDQAQVIDLVNTEYDRLQAKKQNIDNAIYGQERAAMLNESYRLRYVEYTKIMIIVLITFIIVFSAYQFQSTLLTFIPSFLFDLLVFVFCTLSLLYCYFIYSNIVRRDPLYFNELNGDNLLSAAKIQSKEVVDQGTGNLLGSLNINGCIGASCCTEDMYYNEDDGVCYVGSAPTDPPVPT